MLDKTLIQDAPHGMKPSEGATQGLCLVPKDWVEFLKVGEHFDFYFPYAGKRFAEVLELDGNRIVLETFDPRDNMDYAIVWENRD